MSLLKRSIEEDLVVKFRKIGIALRPDWIEEMVSRRKISSFEKLLCLLLNDDIFHTASAGGCLPPFVEVIYLLPVCILYISVLRCWFTKGNQ